MPLSPPLALSLFYLTAFAVMGAYLPYFNLYLEGIGQSGLQIGLLSALLPLCGALAPTAGGMLADRHGRRRDLVILSSFLALLAFAFLLVTRHFAWIALVVVVYSLARALALPLVEASAMEIAEAGGPHYGRMRVWGSVAFILTSLVVGRLIGAWGERLLIGTLLILLALNALAAFLLPRDAPRAVASRAAGALLRLVATPRTALFLAACMLSQASHGPYYVFYSIHLEKAGYGVPAIGLLWALAVGCEVVAILRMPALLARLGTLPTMTLCLLLAALRWGICAMSVAPWAMALAQTLHAASYAAFHVAAVTHTHRLFGADHRASGQAIYSSATYGVGNVVGMLGSGLLYDRIASSTLFAAASWTALAGAGLLFAVSRRPEGGRGV